MSQVDESRVDEIAKRNEHVDKDKVKKSLKILKELRKSGVKLVGYGIGRNRNRAVRELEREHSNTVTLKRE